MTPSLAGSVKMSSVSSASFSCAIFFSCGPEGLGLGSEGLGSGQRRAHSSACGGAASTTPSSIGTLTLPLPLALALALALPLALPLTSSTTPSSIGTTCFCITTAEKIAARLTHA